MSSSPNVAMVAGLARAGLGTVSPETKRLGMHALALGIVAAGGGATGYIIAGTLRGALTGSLIHVGLFGLAGALLGAPLTTTERVVYGGMGLGASVGVGYLWMQRRTR